MISYTDFVRLLTDVSEFDSLDAYVADCGGSVQTDDPIAALKLLELIWMMGHDGLSIRKVAVACGTMSVRQLAANVGVSYRTMSKWAMGESAAPDWALRMVAYAALSNHLAHRNPTICEE